MLPRVLAVISLAVRARAGAEVEDSSSDWLEEGSERGREGTEAGAEGAGERARLRLGAKRSASFAKSKKTLTANDCWSPVSTFLRPSTRSTSPKAPGRTRKTKP